jgi:hypothetical protein
MKFAPLILPVFAAACLSSIHVLPSAGKVAQSAVRMELPLEKGGWDFKEQMASEAEKKTLAKDTEFSKAVCLKPRPGEYDPNGQDVMDRVDLSVVLSGADINNSIHRPERCMPAQGHNILSSNDRNIDLGNGRTIEVKRLRSVQRLPINEKRTEFLELNCVTYYFFVGNDTITESHTRRTLIDMQDRLKKGEAQRWAYVSASMSFSPDGSDPRLPDMDLADRKLRELIGNISARNINWEQIRP